MEMRKILELIKRFRKKKIDTPCVRATALFLMSGTGRSRDRRTAEATAEEWGMDFENLYQYSGEALTDDQWSLVHRLMSIIEQGKIPIIEH